jgi:hypothetical protein
MECSWITKDQLVSLINDDSFTLLTDEVLEANMVEDMLLEMAILPIDLELFLVSVHERLTVED